MPAFAAPYADYVIDARTGEVLHSENADARLHPASLTKMMTLYIAFEAIERGEISLDTKVTISKHAASQAPSKLGLKPGQKIALRYLIRAAAIKSANDAATAIGEAIEGSEPAFAKRMTRTAKAIGMTRSTFKNANGLTAEGHLSTAHDMTILGRHLFYDFPQYYGLFSRRSADAGVAQVSSTNRRFLDSYEGADGIKTGYTVPAGFNLTASAQRGNKRIIATVLGGKSTASRNARMVELLDIGFGKAPNRAVTQEPQKPNYDALEETQDEEMLAAAVADAVAKGLTEVAPAAGKTIRVTAAVMTSPRPAGRPAGAGTAPAGEPVGAALVAASAADMPADEEQTDAMLMAMADSIGNALEEVAAEPAFEQSTAPQPETVALTEPVAAEGTSEEPVEVAAIAPTVAVDEGPAFAQTTAPQPETLGLTEEAPVVAVAVAEETTVRPSARPTNTETVAAIEPATDETSIAPVEVAAAQPQETAPVTEVASASLLPLAELLPAPEPEAIAAAPEVVLEPAPETTPSDVGAIVLTDAEPLAEEPAALEVVTRVSTSGGRQWGVNVGRYPSSYEAEQVLLRTALVEMNTLGDALRKVANRKGGFEANFVGLTQETAELACRRLQARATECNVLAPEG